MATATRTQARTLSVGDRFRLHLRSGGPGVTLWRAIDKTDSDQIVAVGESIPKLLWSTMAEIFEPSQGVFLAVLHHVTLTRSIDGIPVEVAGVADSFELAAHSATLGWLEVVGEDPPPDRIAVSAAESSGGQPLDPERWKGLVMLARALEPVWGDAVCVEASAALAANGGRADA